MPPATWPSKLCYPSCLDVVTRAALLLTYTDSGPPAAATAVHNIKVSS